MEIHQGAPRSARLKKSGTMTRKGEPLDSPFSSLAEWTGLEPATPGVTGRYSNQLNYHSNSFL